MTEYAVLCVDALRARMDATCRVEERLERAWRATNRSANIKCCLHLVLVSEVEMNLKMRTPAQMAAPSRLAV